MVKVRDEWGVALALTRGVYESIEESHALIMPSPKRTCHSDSVPPPRFGNTAIVASIRTILYVKVWIGIGLFVPQHPGSVGPSVVTIRPGGVVKPHLCTDLSVTSTNFFGQNDLQ